MPDQAGDAVEAIPPFVIKRSMSKYKRLRHVVRIVFVLSILLKLSIQMTCRENVVPKPGVVKTWENSFTDQRGIIQFTQENFVEGDDSFCGFNFEDLFVLGPTKRVQFGLTALRYIVDSAAYFFGIMSFLCTLAAEDVRPIRRDWLVYWFLCGILHCLSGDWAIMRGLQQRWAAIYFLLMDWLFFGWFMSTVLLKLRTRMIYATVKDAESPEDAEKRLDDLSFSNFQMLYAQVLGLSFVTAAALGEYIKTGFPNPLPTKVDMYAKLLLAITTQRIVYFLTIAQVTRTIVTMQFAHHMPNMQRSWLFNLPAPTLTCSHKIALFLSTLMSAVAWAVSLLKLLSGSSQFVTMAWWAEIMVMVLLVCTVVAVAASMGMFKRGTNTETVALKEATVPSDENEKQAMV
jgi:hypothetical protein